MVTWTIITWKLYIFEWICDLHSAFIIYSWIIHFWANSIETLQLYSLYVKSVLCVHSQTALVKNLCVPAKERWSNNWTLTHFVTGNTLLCGWKRCMLYWGNISSRFSLRKLNVSWTNDNMRVPITVPRF